MSRRILLGTAVVVAGIACSPESRVPEAVGEPAREFEPPVLTNAAPPVAYPPALWESQVEGTVVLRLFADETGKVVPESTRIAEPSGYWELDSAALAGVRAMRFAPARRHGTPVATEFLQPIHFRHPSRSAPAERP